MNKAALLAVPLALLASSAVPSPGKAPPSLPENDQWHSVSQGPFEQRFSPLAVINRDNVRQLGLAWYVDMPSRWGLEATPIYADGVLYVSSAFSVVHAYSVTTGRELWSYDPGVYAERRKSCCTASNRGVALYKGRVFVGALDGQLIALDARTGRKLWAVQTTPRDKYYSITGAPRIAGGLVVIGNGGAEFGVRGYVTAYDPVTGKQAWRFYTVPGEKPDGAASDAAIEKLARSTWFGKEYLKYGGGGTVWDSMAYDPATDLLYFGVGNASPWNRAIRSDNKGDNLFLSSIVAVRAKTGEYVWHYQETPGESWDFTATASIILADLPIGGVTRKVLLHAPKNGFFYVIDRETGKLISANNFVPTDWASHIDLATGRPVETPEARYEITGKPFHAVAGGNGGHNWHPMAYSPVERLAYIPAQEMPFTYVPADHIDYDPDGPNLGLHFDTPTEPLPPAALRQVQQNVFKGYLLGWDPVANKEVWRVPHAGPWNGGVLATAGGLVFQGDISRRLSAYGAKDGKVLWTSPDLQTAAVAAPMTFTSKGRQYVALMAGFTGSFAAMGGGLPFGAGDPRGPNRLLVFALGGKAKLPARTPVEGDLAPPPATAPAEVVSHGGQLYAKYCFGCHGFAAVSGGQGPDLRHSSTLGGGFKEVVYDGALVSRGMVSFAKWLSPDDVEAIRSYVVSRANQDKARPDLNGATAGQQASAGK